MNLSDKILAEVNTRPGRKAKHIATSLGVTKREVNSILYGQLSARVAHDSAFQWWPRAPRQLPSRPSSIWISTGVPTGAGTALAAPAKIARPTSLSFDAQRPAVITVSSVASGKPCNSRPSFNSPPYDAKQREQAAARGWAWLTVLGVAAGIILGGRGLTRNNNATPTGTARDRSAQSPSGGEYYGSGLAISPSGHTNGSTSPYYPGNGDVAVRGYYRSNGTYVPPHMRSRQDYAFSNNWTTTGNVNPYTGRKGHRTSPPRR